MQEIFDWIKNNNVALDLLLKTIGSVFALITLIKALIEFQFQGKQKSVEFYMKIDAIFDDVNIKKLISLIEKENEEVENTPPTPVEQADRIYYVGLFEQIVLMVNAKAIKKDVALYMFGAFAIDCYLNKNMQQEVKFIEPKSNTDETKKDESTEDKSNSWKLFRSFVYDAKEYYAIKSVTDLKKYNEHYTEDQYEILNKLKQPSKKDRLFL